MTECAKNTDNAVTVEEKSDSNDPNNPPDQTHPTNPTQPPQIIITRAAGWRIDSAVAGERLDGKKEEDTTMSEEEQVHSLLESLSHDSKPVVEGEDVLSGTPPGGVTRKRKREEVVSLLTSPLEKDVTAAVEETSGSPGKPGTLKRKREEVSLTLTSPLEREVIAPATAAPASGAVANTHDRNTAQLTTQRGINDCGLEELQQVQNLFIQSVLKAGIPIEQIPALLKQLAARSHIVFQAAHVKNAVPARPSQQQLLSQTRRLGQRSSEDLVQAQSQISSRPNVPASDPVLAQATAQPLVQSPFQVQSQGQRPAFKEDVRTECSISYQPAQQKMCYPQTNTQRGQVGAPMTQPVQYLQGQSAPHQMLQQPNQPVQNQSTQRKHLTVKLDNPPLLCIAFRGHKFVRHPSHPGTESILQVR